jgi:hypothetical protein
MVADIFAVDLEHADDNGFGDESLDLLFLLHVLVYVLAELSRGPWVINGVKFFNVLVGVEGVFLFKGVEGLNVVGEGEDCALHVAHEHLESIPEPSVLVGEFLLVRSFNLFGLLLGNDGSLDSLLAVSFEEVLHQDGFQLGNFLEALHTVLEDLAHSLHDYLWRRGEAGDYLVRLKDQVKHVEGLNILVLLENGSEPFLGSDNLGDIVSSRHKVS